MTYPGTGQPMTAGVLADGSTVNHLAEHGRTIGFPENVMHYGAKADGVSDDRAAVQAAIDSGARAIFFPPGNYFFADGTGVTLQNHQRLFAQAPRTEGPIAAGTARISVKNAYAFTVPAGFNQNYIEGFHIQVRAGSVTGGGVHLTDCGSQVIRGVRIESTSSNTSPNIYVHGIVGMLIEDCGLFDTGGSQIKVEPGTGLPFANYYTIRRTVCTLAGQAGALTDYAGFDLSGRGVIVEQCDLESQRAYSIRIGAYSENVLIRENWLEGNRNTDVQVGADCIQVRVENNTFEGIDAGHGIDSSLRFVNFVDSTNPNLRHFHSIKGNFIAANNLPSPGINFQIGANIGYTSITNNRGAGLTDIGRLISDGGFFSLIWGNDEGSTTENFKMGPPIFMVTDVANVQKTALRLNSTSRNTTENSSALRRPFVVGDVNEAGSGNYVAVTTEGLLDIHTAGGGPSVNVSQTGSFTPYWNHVNTLESPFVYFRYFAGGATGAWGLVTFNGAANKTVQFHDHAAATTPGSVVKKLPIYDETNTLLGYIPIYNTIT